MRSPERAIDHPRIDERHSTACLSPITFSATHRDAGGTNLRMSSQRSIPLTMMRCARLPSQAMHLVVVQAAGEPGSCVPCTFPCSRASRVESELVRDHSIKLQMYMRPRRARQSPVHASVYMARTSERPLAPLRDTRETREHVRSTSGPQRTTKPCAICIWERPRRSTIHHPRPRRRRNVFIYFYYTM